MKRALQLCAFTFGLVGPFSDKAAKARDNLAVAFPNKSAEWRDQTTREIFRSLGYSAAELVKLEQIWQEREQRIEFVLEPEARKHMESKRATVFMTAHVGAWQVASLVTRQFGFNISTIYAPESNPVMQEFMTGLRQSFGRKPDSRQCWPTPAHQGFECRWQHHNGDGHTPGDRQAHPLFRR